MESPPEAWTALNGGPISPSTNSDDMVTDGGLGEAHADEEVLLVTRADGIGRKETNLIVPPAMSDPRSQENEEAKGVASAAAGKRRGPGTGPNEAHNRRGTPVKPTHFSFESLSKLRAPHQQAAHVNKPSQQARRGRQQGAPLKTTPTGVAMRQQTPPAVLPEAAAQAGARGQAAPMRTSRVDALLRKYLSQQATLSATPAAVTSPAASEPMPAGPALAHAAPSPEKAAGVGARRLGGLRQPVRVKGLMQVKTEQDTAIKLLLHSPRRPTPRPMPLFYADACKSPHGATQDERCDGVEQHRPPASARTEASPEEQPLGLDGSVPEEQEKHGSNDAPHMHGHDLPPAPKVHADDQPEGDEDLEPAGGSPGCWEMHAAMLRQLALEEAHAGEALLALEQDAHGQPRPQRPQTARPWVSGALPPVSEDEEAEGAAGAADSGDEEQELEV